MRALILGLLLLPLPAIGADVSDCPVGMAYSFAYRHYEDAQVFETKYERSGGSLFVGFTLRYYPPKSVDVHACLPDKSAINSELDAIESEFNDGQYLPAIARFARLRNVADHMNDNELKFIFDRYIWLMLLASANNITHTDAVDYSSHTIKNREILDTIFGSPRIMDQYEAGFSKLPANVPPKERNKKTAIIIKIAEGAFAIGLKEKYANYNNGENRGLFAALDESIATLQDIARQLERRGP